MKTVHNSTNHKKCRRGRPSSWQAQGFRALLVSAVGVGKTKADVKIGGDDDDTVTQDPMKTCTRASELPAIATATATPFAGIPPIYGGPNGMLVATPAYASLAEIPSSKSPNAFVTPLQTTATATATPALVMPSKVVATAEVIDSSSRTP
eukprot:CAMPEP_0184503300 /NCGR_PEP_ID=MMETSP0113_2-20130426/51812_1 /TAXON_ID=91329 /ORGANISM="Norrisiella sphaerica, Strain BC52" /LENGTH=149 /DNA_ID=CAMNT_0026892775 /DNA_START=1264 /DNA_END=1713 /DNA_ORIENTATION=-